MQRGLRVITFQQGAIEKFEWLDGNIIISYFDGSNNIFADCSFGKKCENRIEELEGYYSFIELE